MSKDFNTDFSKALNHINSNRNTIPVLEKVATIFATNDTNQDNFIHFQIQIIKLFGEEFAPVLIHFFRNDVQFTPEKTQRTVYAELKNIKLLVQIKMSKIEQIMQNPFKITGHYFSYSEELPNHLISSLKRADGTDFKFIMSFNDGLILLNSLTQNLFEKFDKGTNNIDRNLYGAYKAISQGLQLKVDKLIVNEDSNKDVH